MFADLIASSGVREEFAQGSSVGVMALHGGLEAGTEQLAARVCEACGASRYAVIQPDDLRWHVPSIRYDPALSPRLRAFVDHVDVAVSIHGYGRRGLERTVLVGGRNRSLAADLAVSIETHTSLAATADLDRIPVALRGLHPDNPVNLPNQHGVQLELPSGGRESGDLEDLTTAITVVLRDL